ncbi:MAG: hypothetical protein TR69_WS6001000354 [candidate division WS6 bacterium OLB20]|uniref:Uncharacterized protein n=1 Tax=candidate division WS6 bacterium OLB20 TaxID=1617426 RepID=A0A136M0S8_9BACT|nr:MAG: hypothetical protein TR69_WS6001000354 [candidate division WS6 bacterium OLB20]
MTIYSLPDAGLDVIADYEHLELGGKRVKAPYYMNKRKQKGGLRVMVGKGDPKEMEREVMVLAQVKGFAVQQASAADLRAFLQDCDIGIDCSGFVVHVLNAILAEKHMGTIDQYLVYPERGLTAKLRRLLRPVENTGANTLTSPANTVPVPIQDVRPGDLIRSKGLQKNAHHILLVERVGREDDRVLWIDYVHSSEQYGDDNGIRHGRIEVTDQTAHLKDQNWLEIQDGRNWTLEGLLKDYEDNGLRRLRRVTIPYVEQQQ